MEDKKIFSDLHLWILNQSKLSDAVKIEISSAIERIQDDNASLKSLLRSAHEIIYDLHKYEEGDICNAVHESPCGVKVWLTAYSSLTSSKSGMGE